MVGHKGYPLHRSEDIHPFFIIGPDRSGNTLMRRVLEAHEAGRAGMGRLGHRAVEAGRGKRVVAGLLAHLPDLPDWLV